MPILKQFDIYEVSGGEKVCILSVEATERKEVSDEEIKEGLNELLEIFYDNDKVKLFDRNGNGIVVRGISDKTFIIKALLEE